MYRPKVGEVVEVSDRLNSYKTWIGQEVEILSYAKCSKGYEFVTFWNHKSGVESFVFDGDEFSPLKSKQDTEIEEIESILNSGGGWVEPALRLYNAGYRKEIPYDEFLGIIEQYFNVDFDFSKVISEKYSKELAAKLNRTPEDSK